MDIIIRPLDWLTAVVVRVSASYLYTQRVQCLLACLLACLPVIFPCDFSVVGVGVGVDVGDDCWEIRGLRSLNYCVHFGSHPCKT